MAESLSGGGGAIGAGGVERHAAAIAIVEINNKLLAEVRMWINEGKVDEQRVPKQNLR